MSGICDYTLSNDDDSIVIGVSEICERETSVLAFDLDYTLIRPKSGNKFSKSSDDWVWVDGMQDAFKKAFQIYPIVVFTNQGGIEKGKVTKEDFIKKIHAVFGSYLSTCRPDNNHRLYIIAGISVRWRKPLPTMWEFFIENIAPNVQPAQCVFVGDAAGRDGDFSDSDCKFASNCDVKFYTPGEFIKASTTGFSLSALPPGQYDKRGVKVFPMTLTPIANGCITDINTNRRLGVDDGLNRLFMEPAIVVIYVGSPASGKTTLTKQFVERGFKVINQDTIMLDRNGHAKPGTKTQCKKRLAQLLCDTKNHPGDAAHLHKIVIDATHPDVESRKEYIDMVRQYAAYGYKVSCVWMNLTVQRCKWLNLIRCYAGGKYIPEIAFGVYKKKFKRPDIVEGFDSIVVRWVVYWDPTILPVRILDWKL